MNNTTTTIKTEYKHAILINYGVRDSGSLKKGSLIHLEIFPKDYKGELLARTFGASKENPTINLYEYETKKSKKVQQDLLKNLIRILDK